MVIKLPVSLISIAVIGTLLILLGLLLDFFLSMMVAVIVAALYINIFGGSVDTSQMVPFARSSFGTVGIVVFNGLIVIGVIIDWLHSKGVVEYY